MCQPHHMNRSRHFALPPLRQLTQQGLAPAACLLAFTALPPGEPRLNQERTRTLEPEHVLIQGHAPCAETAQNVISKRVANRILIIATGDRSGRRKVPLFVPLGDQRRGIAPSHGKGNCDLHPCTLCRSGPKIA